MVGIGIRGFKKTICFSWFWLLPVFEVGLKRIEETDEEDEEFGSFKSTQQSVPTSEVGEVEADEIPELDSLTLRIRFSVISWLLQSEELCWSIIIIMLIIFTADDFFPVEPIPELIPEPFIPAMMAEAALVPLVLDPMLSRMIFLCVPSFVRTTTFSDPTPPCTFFMTRSIVPAFPVPEEENPEEEDESGEELDPFIPVGAADESISEVDPEFNSAFNCSNLRSKYRCSRTNWFFTTFAFFSFSSRFWEREWKRKLEEKEKEIMRNCEMRKCEEKEGRWVCNSIIKFWDIIAWKKVKMCLKTL